MRRRFWRAVAPKLAGWRLRSEVPRDSLRGKGEELAAVGGRAFLLARAPGLALAVARELEQGASWVLPEGGRMGWTDTLFL